MDLPVFPWAVPRRYLSFPSPPCNNLFKIFAIIHNYYILSLGNLLLSISFSLQMKGKMWVTKTKQRSWNCFRFENVSSWRMKLVIDLSLPKTSFSPLTWWCLTRQVTVERSEVNKLVKSNHMWGFNSAWFEINFIFVSIRHFFPFSPFYIDENLELNFLRCWFTG